CAASPFAHRARAGLVVGRDPDPRRGGPVLPRPGGAPACRLVGPHARGSAAVPIERALARHRAGHCARRPPARLSSARRGRPQVPAYLRRRLGWILIVFWFALTTTFALAYVVPADPARAAAGPHASATQLALLRTRLCLDRPLVTQYGCF